MAGQGFHLAGNNRKALARIARPGGLDGGIQRQEVGLVGNIGDDLNHLANPQGKIFELLDRFARFAGFFLGVGRNRARLGDLFANFPDGVAKLLSGRGDGVDTGGDFF